MAGRSTGRRPLAPKVHLLRGTYQRVRHAGHDTPEPPPGKPEPPGPLSPVAQAEWDRMVVRLEKSGALSIVDDAALWQYAKLYAETEQIEVDQARERELLSELTRELKRTKSSGDRTVIAEQLVKLQMLIDKATRDLRQGRMAIRQYLVEFGMTPSARSRVKLPPPAPKVDPNKTRYFGTSA